MVRSGIFAACIALAAAPLTVAAASPPPPPSTYVEEAEKLLAAREDAGTAERLASFVAGDVKAYVNGRLVAGGKRGWMRRYAATQGTGGILAYSYGREANGESLMIVDQFDAVDRANLPPGLVADPRFLVRSTLYEFGADHKIHFIRTLTGPGFWIRPRD